MKEHYKEAVRIYLQNNPGSGIRRADFPKLFRTVYFKVATISNSVNSFRATGLYSLNINKIPDYAYATAETIGHSEAQNMDNVAGHLNNNHHSESNNNAVLIQPDADVNAIVRPRQKRRKCYNSPKKNLKKMLLQSVLTPIY